MKFITGILNFLALTLITNSAFANLEPIPLFMTPGVFIGSAGGGSAYQGVYETELTAIEVGEDGYYFKIMGETKVGKFHKIVGIFTVVKNEDGTLSAIGPLHIDDHAVLFEGVGKQSEDSESMIIINGKLFGLDEENIRVSFSMFEIESPGGEKEIESEYEEDLSEESYSSESN